MVIYATIEITLTLFLTLMVAAQLIALRFKVPYTLVLVFIGIAITALPLAALIPNPISETLQTSVQWMQSIYGQMVESGLFVGLIVPPLLFEAMMHIKKRELRAMIRPSVTLATFGVLLSTTVTSLVVWKLAGIPLPTALLFAVIISPTDTITVLQVFRHIRVPARLSAMMDMEASFNDATAIVLFTILLSSVGLKYTSIFNGIDLFLYNFLAGTAIGFAVAWVMKGIHIRIDDKLAETILTLAAVYGSYVLATAIGASGLLAVVVVGLYFGNSTLTSGAISKPVRRSILSFWEIAAFIGNTVAFLFIGFETNMVIFFQAAGLILIAYLSTMIARIVIVYPTLALSNRPERKIPLSWSNMATLGGVRGALSIALLATLASSASLHNVEVSTLTAMVLGVVFLSLVVQVPILSNYASRAFGRHKPSHAE